MVKCQETWHLCVGYILGSQIHSVSVRMLSVQFGFLTGAQLDASCGFSIRMQFSCQFR